MVMHLKIIIPHLTYLKQFKKKKAIRIKNIATYNSKKKKTYRNFDDSFFTDDNNSEEGRGGGRGGESGNLVIAKKITEGQNNIQN